MSTGLWLTLVCLVCAGTAAMLLLPSARIREPTFVNSQAVVVGMRTTGVVRDDFREVVLDLMVTRPAGGQFPAHETALIPEASLSSVSPGSLVATFYRSDDESAVAVCVPA